jgi:hypothetical protein
MVQKTKQESILEVKTVEKVIHQNRQQAMPPQQKHPQAIRKQRYK